MAFGNSFTILGAVETRPESAKKVGIIPREVNAYNSPMVIKPTLQFEAPWRIQLVRCKARVFSKQAGEVAKTSQ
jgi:hypothetical protein